MYNNIFFNIKKKFFYLVNFFFINIKFNLLNYNALNINFFLKKKNNIFLFEKEINRKIKRKKRKK